MAMPGKRTKQQRKIKRKGLGVSGKRRRENHGTTPRIPLTGELPTVSFGQKVADDKVTTDKWSQF